MPRVTNLRSTATTSTTITMAWSNCAASLQCSLHADRAGGGGSFATPLLPGAEEGTLVGLSANTDYDVHVRVGGEMSAVVRVTTDPGETGPDAPSEVIGTTVDHTAIDWSWTDNSGNEQGFQFELSEVRTGAIVRSVALAAGTTSIRTGGLRAASLYSARVQALHASLGNSEWSEAAYASTRAWQFGSGGGSGLVNPPTAASGLLVTFVAQTQATFQWRYAVVDDHTSTKVQLFDSASRLLRTVTLAVSATQHTWTGLNPNTTYYTSVLLGNENGSTGSARVTFTTLTIQRPAPTPPADVEATALSSGTVLLPGLVKVSFDATGCNADLISIFRDTVPATLLTRLIADVSPLAGQWIDEDAEAGVTYVYSASSQQVSGVESARSAEDQITIPVLAETPPGSTPTHAMVALDSDTLLATWEFSGSDITHFRWEISTVGSSGPWTTQQDNIAGSQRYLSATGKSPETQYWSRIVAVGGEEAISNVATDTTPAIPAAPEPAQDVQVTVYTPHLARVTWQPGGVRVSRFAVRLSIAGAAYFDYAENISPALLLMDLTSLTPNASHRVVIRSTNESGTSDSEAVTFVTPPLASGDGATAAHGREQQYTRGFASADSDVDVVFDSQVRIIEFRSVPPDLTDGPFVEIYLDGVLTAVAGGDTGEAVLRNRVVPAGTTISRRTRGVGTGVCKTTMLVEML